MTTRIKCLKQKLERLCEERDTALEAIEKAQSKIKEIESVCTDAHHTINDLVYQVHYWEKKYQNLKSNCKCQDFE